MRLLTAPVTLAEANAYIAAFHRHNGPLPTAKFAIAAVSEDGLVVGVVMAGLPKARLAMARGTIEVSRVCTMGEPNACSLLYGAAWRAARALGYRRAITYTLEAEEGASLSAAGWTPEARWDGGSWVERRGTGFDGHDLGPKVRWAQNATTPLPDIRWPKGIPSPATLFDS